MEQRELTAERRELDYMDAVAWLKVAAESARGGKDDDECEALACAMAILAEVAQCMTR